MTDLKSIVLFISIVGSFLIAFLVSSINVALPLIGKDLSIGAILLTWINTAYLLTATVLLVPFGRLSDIYGRKRIYLYGVITFTVASMLCAISNSYWTIILARIIQGIGASMLFSTSTAILTSVFPVGERGKALGINTTAVYIGISIGPFLGGILTRNLGWRSIFFFSVILGIFVTALIVSRLKEEWAEAKGEDFDSFGSILYCTALIGIVYGFTKLPDIIGLSLFLLGVLILGMFFLRETRTRNPILDVSLFLNNRVFTFSSLSALINYSATSAIAFLLSLYLQQIKGLDPQNTGIILLFQPLVQALFSPVAGRLSDRIQPGVVASLGMLFTTIGLFLLRFIEVDTPISFIIASAIILGFGFGLFSSPNVNAIMSSVDRKFYGIASSMVGTMRMFGQTFSMGIVTIVFTMTMGELQQIGHSLMVSSIKLIFTIFSILCFIGIFFSLSRGKLTRE